MIDIYFEKKYGRLYEKIEKGKCLIYEFENKFGKIHHMFIKREIPLKLNGNTYYDLVTPYGYGGPIIIDCDKEKKELLLHEFEKDFQNYCIDNNIISEFVRFHPVVENHSDFGEVYDVSYIRNTVGTTVNSEKDYLMNEFSKSARKSIRKALKEGVTYKVTRSPDNISEFLNVYYSTMDRNNASDYYYFDNSYFEECMENLKDNILLIEVSYNEKIIAMGFYFVYNNMIHAHLSGTLTEYLYLSPAYVIKHATAEWAKENGISLIHYGGGTSNNDDDPLYKFKKKFTKSTEFEFNIGKKIWNKSVYDKLCGLLNINEEIEFFPAYRYK